MYQNSFILPPDGAVPKLVGIPAIDLTIKTMLLWQLRGHSPLVPVVGIPILIGLLIVLSFLESSPERPHVSVAFIGNSIQYYNDFPRFMEALSDGHISQNSCLHGNADLSSLFSNGNGMYDKWNTGPAKILEVNFTYNNQGEDQPLYDFGACSVAQLLFGADERLTDYLNFNVSNNLSDESDNLMENDGTNPCFENPWYYSYLQSKYQYEGPPRWDYIVINDNTRSPCCTTQRANGIEMLRDVYIPWFLDTGATPIFLDTHAYWAPTRDMRGLTDIPTFTSLSYEGYREYINIVSTYLPPEQQPRLAPVGLAFLMVWEEDFALWESLIHYDHIHPSPSGTFLQGCIVYAAIFGKLPPVDIITGHESFQFFEATRRMVPTSHRQKPFPTRKEVLYLYHVAQRIMIEKQLPKSLIQYHNQDSVYYEPDDELYANNNTRNLAADNRTRRRRKRQR